MVLGEGGELREITSSMGTREASGKNKLDEPRKTNERMRPKEGRNDMVRLWVVRKRLRDVGRDSRE